MWPSVRRTAIAACQSQPLRNNWSSSQTCTKFRLTGLASLLLCARAAHCRAPVIGLRDPTQGLDRLQVCDSVMLMAGKLA